MFLLLLNSKWFASTFREDGKRGRQMLIRCPWCGDDPLYRSYHDNEWGVPVHDDQRLFEMLVLEGAQAGLSWLTILKKRDNYRRAFEGFHPDVVARYGEAETIRLLSDAGIVRNKLKIKSAITNARAVLAVIDTYGSLDAFLWDLAGGVVRQNHWQSMEEVPASTVVSDAMSKTLKKHGFSFVGTTICYAFMQSVGMVNDHLVSCYRFHEVQAGKGPED